MNVIVWNDKPANYDIHNVERIWFVKSMMHYTVAGSGNFVYKAPVRTVDTIVPEEVYRGRPRSKESA